MEITWITSRRAAHRRSIPVEGVIDEEVIWYNEQADEKDLQREIDDLKRKFHRAQRKQTPSSSDVSSNDEGDASYKERSETPPSESYSYEEEHSHKRRRKSPSGRG